MLYPDLSIACDSLVERLVSHGYDVDPGHWQGVETKGRPDMRTLELLNVCFTSPVPRGWMKLGAMTKANLPWAEDHFQERVGREPTNPGREYLNWPWWRGQDEKAMEKGGIFTHTYQERYWPKRIGRHLSEMGNAGTRYALGDLDDVVSLLRRQPTTRQAYLPVYFPEDTGSVHHGRVPCTLGYGFMRRDPFFNIWYAIRSCDAIRHFRDDVYLTCRLAQWVLAELGWELDIVLHFTAFSFHAHMGDLHVKPG